MELVYLWVEDYKNIHKQGFNFSPRFSCEYDDVKNELTIKENNDYIENFFGENINITAIVGKNGSGKSRILEIITLFRFKKLNKYLENKNILIIFKHKDILYIPYSYNDSFIGESFKSFDLNHVITNTSFKIYSKEYIFDESLYWLTLFTNGLSDFTEGQNLLRGGHFKSFYNGSDNYGDDEEYKFYRKFSIILKDNTNIFKVLGEDFVFDSMYIELDLTKFIFSIDNNDIEELKEIKYFVEGNIDNHSIILGEPEREITKEIITYNFLVSDFLLKYINILTDPPIAWNKDKVLEIFFKNELMPKINLIIEQFKKEKDNNRLPIYLRLILELIKENYNNYKKILYKKTKGGEIEHFEGNSKELEFINKYEECVEYITNNFELDNKTLKLKTPISSISQEKVSSFYQFFVKNDFYKELHLSGRLYFNFIHSQKNHITFNSLSTGEKQLLKFITNLIYTLIDTKYENRIILLDEIETTFHPQWQKKFINIVMRFINEIREKELIPKENKYHLIFVTHSPFILSDIPKQNIIFLDKEENGNCKVLTHDEVLNKKQTFGANIHTLLSDSFFMENSLMGEFAKSKINKIKEFYEKVKREKKTDENIKFYNKHKEKFWQIQKIIGEPFLKTVIKNYLDEIETILFEDKAKQIAIKRFINEFGERTIKEVMKNDKSKLS